MFRWLRKLLSSGTNTAKSEAASFAGGSDWEWQRGDEYEYEHYNDAMEDIKQLKREKKHEEVIELLEWCIDYTEAEAEADDIPGSAPAPAYYRHLGIVLRKENQYEEEVAILVHDGQPREELLDRLERARELESG